MKIINELKLMVITGSWNTKIFTDDWIKKFLLSKDDFNSEVSFLMGSHRISTDKIRIEFFSNRLNFIARKMDKETYDLISEISTKIADYLPHTPVLAYGVNFVFECKKKGSLVNLIKVSDIDNLKDNDYEIINTSHKHSFKVDKNLVNLTISSGTTDKVLFDFNFHFDLKNFVDFKDKLYNAPINNLEKDALDILKNVYSLNMGE